MARSIAERGDILSRLQTLGRDIGGQRGGGHRDDGAGQLRPPPPAMPAWRAPIQTDEAERNREAAEQLHASRNPGAAICSCACRRWESSRDAAGHLVWLCSGCHLRHGAKPLPRAEPMAPLPPLDPEVAREALRTATAAVAAAVAEHDQLSRAATASRGAIAQAEEAVETANEALSAAQSDAVAQARRALEAGQTVPAAGLGKVRAGLEHAQDALLTARTAAGQIASRGPSGAGECAGPCRRGCYRDGGRRDWPGAARADGGDGGAVIEGSSGAGLAHVASGLLGAGDAGVARVARPAAARLATSARGDCRRGRTGPDGGSARPRSCC